MNILFLARLYTPHVGGVERHVKRLSDELITKGHQVIIITEKHEESLADSEKIADARVYRIPLYGASEKNKKWPIWRWIWQHRQLFRQADVIHAHDVFFWYWPLRFFYWNKPVFTTFHGYEGTGEPTLQAKLQRKLTEWFSHRTICVGAFMKKWYWAKPDKILYGASDALRSVRKPAPNSAIYLGRLSADAGIMSYLKLITILQNQGHKIKLDVYGDGPLRSKAEQYVKKHQILVKFFGFIPDISQKIPEYELAFVSRYLAIAEAMVSKRLVLAFYNNEIKEDYLRCHPQAKQMLIAKKADDMAEQLQSIRASTQNIDTRLRKAQAWAKKATWQWLAKEYLQLWHQD